MSVNFKRQDRGLDHTRIEKIASMLTERINHFIYDRNDDISSRKEEIKQEAIVHFELQPQYDAIAEYEKKIELLEEEISQLKELCIPHKREIAKLMRGTDEIYDYRNVKKNSPVWEYIAQRMPDPETIKTELRELNQIAVEKLWLASDIDEARSIYESALSNIDTIISGAAQ